MIDRRSLLGATGASLALAALGLPADALAAQGLQLGRPAPFSFDRLVALSRTLAASPYLADRSLPADVLQRIDYDAHGRIRFDTDHALFRNGPGPFPVSFFHLGRFFPVPVHMFVLESAAGDGFAREILYDAAAFSMPADSPARKLPDGAGFAGFKVQESRLGDQGRLPWQKNDWVAFLGASYFRAIGELYQYGLSARGIALDAAVPDRPEEFPDFTRFYFEPPAEGSDAMTIYALLEGPSLAGAYKFVLTRGKGVLMDIECRLFLRREVQRFGLAPLTSMFWYSESQKPTAIDWRPEVHDSDGLAMWNGAGERIWRPLNNPTQTRASTFSDNNPKGFGLLQRDRSFDHYQDGVYYEKRPSLWVEPVGSWGEGQVQLIEIPTDDEIHDNVLACWVPKAPAAAGSSVTLKYRLHWTAEEPFPSPLARCIATRMGRGGQPGQPRPAGVRKFMVEFIGKPLETLPSGVKPELVLTAARGKFSYVFSEAVPNGVPGHWRAQFDFTPEGNEPVDMRLYLRNGDQTLSETWLFQYQPGGNVG
ncbi:glucan biosynthesis protein D [Variovorax sp. J22P168]|uniref:glucan biosynthesis protein n=1 Tax=Variovorax jilinensis TaxID=3053513 RepID=UPI002578DFA4|nr:glucan biosynthesis protein D [Variovorax sp. J22P168]MDM0011903.1 glucan biosynthesis protein D [Variovorax sp. J22P168]